MSEHTRHLRTLLSEIDSGAASSQRTLARRLGIALGLTNLLLRRVIAKGWVKAVRVQPNRVRYLLTPTGIAEKTRLTREYLQSSLHFYADARERVRRCFEEVSSDLDGTCAAKRVMFYGAGELAEIGYVSLQGTDLQLVGVVDPDRPGPFLGVPVLRPDELRHLVDGEPQFDRLIVMSFAEVDAVRRQLDATGLPVERVTWI
jgi:DNA-binding MarR family transcriptional regulator